MGLEDQIHKLVGMQIVDCQSDLDSICNQHGYMLNIQDPSINTGNIDYNPKRLNIMTDNNSVIKGFTVG